MTLDLSTKLTRSESIVFTSLDDTIVMMDVNEGHYYELDPVATRIWELIDAGSTVEAICDALVDQYEVDPQECRQDTLEFLERAAERGLVLAA